MEYGMTRRRRLQRYALIAQRRLPYTPLAGLMGFTPLPLTYLLVIFGIVARYFLSAELTKHWFYRQSTNHG